MSLKKEREKMKLSQSQLAVLSDIPLRTLQCYESGEKKISSCNVKRLLKLSEILDTTIEEIIKE